METRVTSLWGKVHDQYVQRNLLKCSLTTWWGAVHILEHDKRYSVIRQPPNPTLLSSPIECLITEVSLYIQSTGSNATQLTVVSTYKRTAQAIAEHSTYSCSAQTDPVCTSHHNTPWMPSACDPPNQRRPMLACTLSTSTPQHLLAN